MKTLGQDFGFWLNSFDESLKEKHEMINKGIGLVCKTVHVCSKKVGIDNIVLGFPLIVTPDSKTFLSVCLYNNTVLFGVYDAITTKIRHEFTQQEFDKLNYRIFDDFANRCGNRIWQVAKGDKHIELVSLSCSWDTHIKENPVLVQTVRAAQSGKYIFLEQKDLEERE